MQTWKTALFASLTLLSSQVHAGCSPKEVIALSASGYSKSEIDQLCSQTQAEQLPGAGYVEIPTIELPKEVNWDGEIVKSATWNDNNGTNYLLITETGDYPIDPRSNRNCDDDYCHSAELYGYHYVDDGNRVRRLWKIQDFIKGCSYDITLDYLQGSLEITDLDGDGISETSFLYRLACRSDVSGADMKLMMHEGTPKYAIRGTTRTPYEPGEMRVDPAFNKAPSNFQTHAVERWKLFQDEFFEYINRDQ